MDPVKVAAMIRDAFIKKGYPTNFHFMFWRKTEDDTNETRFYVYSVNTDYGIFDAERGEFENFPEKAVAQ